MTRGLAMKTLRDLLDAQGLRHWKIRLTTDFTKPFLGLCDYKISTIMLNAHHIDTHPDEEIINTIRHEVAHALTPGHGHNDIWATKARELGCDNTLPCAHYGLSDTAIDAIRSGAELEVTFEEQVIRTPKYSIKKLQEKCPVCDKIAVEKSSFEQKTSSGRVRIVILQCNHMVSKPCDSQSPFEDITFDGDPKCNHKWDKTVCYECGAKRLYSFQIEGARALERANGRFAVLDEMGLGKTIQALAYLKLNKQAWPFLWVTKSGTKYQHAREMIRILDCMPPQILSTGKDKVIKGFNAVASYDIFRRIDLAQFDSYKTIVLDECQAIKNPDSTRTQCIRKIVKEHNLNVIPLSGTFWKNRGSEAFVMLNMLDPMMFNSYERFKREWVDYYWDGGRKKEGGFINPEKFREKIAHIAIRRERKEVLPELPLINRTRVLCEVPDYARKTYQEEENKIIGILKDMSIDGNDGSFEDKSAIMASLMLMRQIVGIAKVPTTVEHAQEFLEETDRKLVIFVHHIKCGEMIHAQLTTWCAENEIAEPLILTGGMSSEERIEIQDKFNGPNARVLIASTLASGEGLNLQTCADCIMHERQWNPANEEQAEGRFIRIGQQAQQVNAIYIHGDDTVDTILNSIVEAKRMHFHSSMNKGEMPVWHETSIIDELIKAIGKKKRVA